MNPIPFTSTFKSFIKPEIEQIDDKLSGIYLICNFTGEDFIPVLWGRGKIKESLLLVMKNPYVMKHQPKSFNYILNSHDEEGRLEKLKKESPALCD
jgi:hypothetical protein